MSNTSGADEKVPAKADPATVAATALQTSLHTLYTWIENVEKNIVVMARQHNNLCAVLKDTAPDVSKCVLTMAKPVNKEEAAGVEGKREQKTNT